MKHSCTHWRSCLGPASVPVHSSALLTWGGQHGHHHYGEDELRVGPRLRSHLRAGRELPSDRHLLGQPLLLTRGGQPPHLPLRLAQFLLAPALPRQLLHHGSQHAERGHSVRTRRGRVGRDLGGYGTAYPAIYWPGYVAGIGRAIHYRAGEQLLSPPGLQLSATPFCLLLC